MKKITVLIIVLLVSSIVLKYYISPYSVRYTVNDHNVITTYKNGRTYYEIDGIYNFNIYSKRSLKKDLITQINNIKDENLKCIIPYINNKSYNPLCIYNNEYIDYNLIDNEYIDYNLIDNEYINKYKDKIDNSISSSFTYYNTDSNTYIALWNYKGYYLMNDNEYVNVELFDNDRYSNDLAYLVDNNIYSANYDCDHEYDSLIKLDLITKKKSKISLEYNIDFDSYIVGYIENCLYIFDNKYSVLYEINLTNNKTTIKSNNEKGFVKYVDGKFISCSKSDYKVNKIKFDEEEKSIYTYKKENDNTYKILNDNSDIKMIISNSDIEIIKEYKDKIYYILNESLYSYSYVDGIKHIFYFLELNFNKDNTIFIYNM